MKSLVRTTLLLACAIVAGAVTNADAQPFPSRPVRMVVPYAPGGTPDVVARILGHQMAEAMGQSFIVDNRPSAGGIAAAEIIKGSPPDGYNLLMSDIQQLAINPFLFSNLPYDAGKDFTPVSLVASIPLYVVVQSSLKINTLPELVAYTKAHPGELSYGSSGIGSIHHITMESLKAALGMDIVHVPYKGAGQSVPAFLAGDVQVLISALPALAQHLKSGKGGKLLVVTTLKRSPQTPEVPAVSEYVPGFDFSSEMGFVAPANTPPEVVQRLSAEFAKALKNPEVMQKLTELGAVPIGTTPAGYADNIHHNLDVFATAVKRSGAKVN
jgi:tripartite-type tricarboxylate transporter receptor subunit TctC